MSKYQKAYDKMKPRPQLHVFMLACEEQLQKNDHKGGWDKDTPEGLLRRLIEEVGELSEALCQYHQGVVGGCDRVKKEAADVANFAMMIADVVRKKE